MILHACRKETPREVVASVQNVVGCSKESERTASVTLTENPEAKLPLVQNKRQKVSGPEEGGTVGLKATENSMLEWLENSGDGVGVISDPNLCVAIW